MTKQIKIACLPVAGIQNPYQKLMMEGLNESGRLVAFNGIDNRFWGILLTAIKQNPDYIHFDWIVSFYYRRYLVLTLLSIPIFFLQLLIVKYILKIKIVWTIHNILPHDLPYQKIHSCCQNFLIMQCCWVRVFSETSQKKIGDLYRYPIPKIKIIPEGSFVSYYPNHITKQQARQDLGIPENSTVLLYFGLIKPYKGIMQLIEAYNRTKIENCYLVIAGKVMDHEYGQKVKHLCNPYILLFDHFIPNENVQTYFQAADIVVLPFEKIENSGSVILAMGFSKPIIAPHIGSIINRLKNQEFLLFNKKTTIEDKLKLAFSFHKKQLSEVGIHNFLSLKAFDWTDFQSCFE